MRVARGLFVIGLLALSGCAPGFNPHPPVPPVPAEPVPAPPPSRSTLIWQPGHYDWDGVGYAWVPGSWVERGGHGALWQDGYWRETRDGSVWMPAHWM